MTMNFFIIQQLGKQTTVSIVATQEKYYAVCRRELGFAKCIWSSVRGMGEEGKTLFAECSKSSLESRITWGLSFNISGI